MKSRVLLFSLIIAVLFALVACNINSNENTNCTDNTNSTDNISSTNNTESTVNINNSENNATFDNQEWTWVGPRTKRGVLTEDGYYYVDPTEMKLSYADLTGKGSIILCTTVGCKHNTSECDAHLTNHINSPIFFWNGHLYYVDEIHTNALWRRDSIGLNLLEIGKVGANYAET